MKIYKYWRIEKATLNIGQKATEVKCYGGSNISEDDAGLKAKEKIEKIKRKIAGDRHVFDSYDVEIREEIVRAIDEKAIVTRNRYGAQILNAQEIMILDIDQPKFSLWDVFRRKDDAQSKQKIVEMIRKLAQKSSYQEYGFRVYETQKGMRVIVLGKAFDAKSGASQAMMKEFNCDGLYMLLCKKQDCFRARLTPKPSRMKQRGYKVKFPRSAEEEQLFQTWLLEYEAASKNFSVCKFIEQLGAGHSIPEAVRFHDDVTQAYRGQKLA
jgi:hypothetical protein